MTRNQNNELKLGRREIAFIIAILSLLGVNTGTNILNPTNTKLETTIEEIQKDVVEMKVTLEGLKTEIRMRDQ